VNVRHQLLRGFLVVAAMMSATGAVVLHADAQSTQAAAVTEAEQIARGIAKDVAVGLPPDSDGHVHGPMLDDAPGLAPRQPPTS
jgi:hypothetical protein